MNSDKVIELLRDSNVFLTGKAGTGKSYITKEIIKKVKNPIVLGSTGMAAMNIGGSTVHSFFKLGLSNNEEQLEAYDNYQKERLKKKGIPEASWDRIIFSNLTKALSVARLIIIDEISMLSRDVLDLVFKRLRQFTWRRIPILVVGDFYQLPPINAEYAFKSVDWNFKTIELVEVKRTNNLEFATIQSKVRSGEINKEITDYLKSLSKNIVDRPLKIFSRNVDVAQQNKIHLDSIKGDLISVDTVFRVNNPGFETQIIDSFIGELKIDKVFLFKIGARVMSVINDGFSLVNGLLGTIKDFKDNIITFLTDYGKEITICKHVFKKLSIETVGGEITMVEVAAATQFPLVIAAAITIHKSQGLTIDRLSIDCKNIFERGQFYVALSRGVDPENINISSFEEKYIIGNETVDEFYKNVGKHRAQSLNSHLVGK
jgi:ATP-dependent DNA helicase PIF1